MKTSGYTARVGYGAVGDCNTCTRTDCLYHKVYSTDEVKRGVNPILTDYYFCAFIKMYGPNDLKYSDIEHDICGSRPVPFSDPPDVIAMHGLPVPRETVMVLWSGGDEFDGDSGLLFRLTWDDPTRYHDKHIRYQTNAIDGIGVF